MKLSVYILITTIFFGCEDSSNSNNNNLSSKGSFSSESSISTQNSSFAESSSSSEISSLIDSNFSSENSISSISQISSSSSTIINNEETNNSSFFLETDDNNITLFYGDDVKFGTEKVTGKWYFSNKPPIVSSWEHIELKSDSTFIRTSGLTPQMEEYRYGITEDGKSFYIDFGKESGFYIAYENLNFKNSDGACIEIEPHYLSNFDYVRFMCPEALAETYEENTTLIVDVNNSGNTERIYKTYDQKETKLYFADNTKFGTLPIVGDWRFKGENGVSHRYYFKDTGYEAGSSLSFVPTFTTPYGITENGQKLYMELGSHSEKSITIDEVKYIIHDYVTVELLEVQEENCYKVEILNWPYEIDYTSFCKITD